MPAEFFQRQLLRELNDRLPSSIAVVSCQDAPARFHARHDAVSRTYFINIRPAKPPFRSVSCGGSKSRWDVPKMQAAAALIAGRHDFIQFRSKDPSRPEESTVVVVNAAESGRRRRHGGVPHRSVAFPVEDGAATGGNFGEGRLGRSFG